MKHIMLTALAVLLFLLLFVSFRHYRTFKKAARSEEDIYFSNIKKPEIIRVACISDGVSPFIFHYPGHLQKLLGARFLVKSFNIHGFTISHTKEKLRWNHPGFEQIFLFQPNLILIMLGNDCLPYQETDCIRPFIDDYKKLIQYYLTLPSAPEVCVLTPASQKDSLSAAIRNMTTEHDFKLIDIEKAIQKNQKLFGKHPFLLEPERESFLANTVYNILLQRL